MRILNTVDAVREAHELILRDNPCNILIGEGVPDPKSCFGTTRGLFDKFPKQVFDSPVSEAGVTGICIGASLHGIKPIFIHMRQDFLFYPMDQIANNAAKWHSMFGGNGGSVPIVIKAFTGRGWGAGHQHSQNLESIFAHIPGLKVLVPSSPRTAKGLLIAAARSPNPCIILEDRWIHHLTGPVEDGAYASLIDEPDFVRQGRDGAIICWGQLVSEAVRAATILEKEYSLSIRIIDLQTLSCQAAYRAAAMCSNLNKIHIYQNAWFAGAFAHAVAACFDGRARVFTFMDYYPSSAPAMTEDYYLDHNCMVEDFLGQDRGTRDRKIPHDVPDASFTGPF